MNATRFNQHIAAGRAAAEGNLAALERGYRITLQAAARHAGDRFAALSTDHLVADITDPKWTPPENDQLVDPAAMAADAEKRTRPARMASLKAVLAPVLADIGIAYDLTNPLIAGLVDKLAVRAADMGDAVRGDIAKAVLAAYQQGLSVVDTAKSIQSAVEGVAPARAAMLARTDLVGLANGASVAAAQLVVGNDGESGLGFKQWLATEDERTRETHSEADGQIVPIDDVFTVGGEQAAYPGDPDLSDSEAINCRCTVVYLDASEAAGGVTADAGPDVSNLAMVAVYPRAHEATSLAVDGGLEPDDLHCTLLFLGDADTFDVQALKDTVASTARALPAIDGMVGGAAHFAEGPDGYPSIVLPDVQGLSTVQETVRANLSEAGIKSPSEHGFTPHMTLSYASEPQVPDPANLGTPIHFDALSVVVAKQRMDYALTGPMIAAAMQAPTGDVTSQGLMDESPDDTTAAVTVTVDGDEQTDMSEAEVRWQAVLCIEGVQTDDGRMLDPGSITWRDLPLSLGAMFETPHSYDASAEICGRIDAIWRNGNQIMGSGVFGTDDVGCRAAEMVANLSLRGISVDLGILAYELRQANPPVATDETDDTPDEETDIADVITEMDNLIFVVTDGVIGAATVCPFQAIAGATIAVVADAGSDRARFVQNSCFVLTIEQPAPVAELVATGWQDGLDALGARFDDLLALMAERESDFRERERSTKALIAAAVDEASVPKKLLTDIGQSLTSLSEEITRKPRTVEFVRDADGKLAGTREG